MSRLTEAERENMRHALGLNRGSNSYRNSFVTDIGCDDARVWHGLVARSLADVFPYMMAPNSLRFSVTELGRAALQKDTDNG